MASIEKIYGTYEQHDELANWCKEHKPEALDFFFAELWYNLDWYDEGEYPIANFPEDIDMWLLENCPLDWVVKRIKYQYCLDKVD